MNTTRYIPGTLVSYDTVFECGDLINEAYAQLESPKSWKIPDAYEILSTFRARSIRWLPGTSEPFGFVARKKENGDRFVIFRGTRTGPEWLADFDALQCPHEWGAVAKGFSHIYQQCSPDVIAAVPPGSFATYVTGHSLGAALAVLAAADLKLRGRSPYLISFAGPRVGDPLFAKIFNDQVSGVRFFNTEDLVPTVPPAVAELQFAHVAVPACFTSHKGTLSANHAMETYMESLK